MKTNSWKITFMALAMATAMTGCNQIMSWALLLRRVKKMY